MTLHFKGLSVIIISHELATDYVLSRVRLCVVIFCKHDMSKISSWIFVQNL